MDKRALIVFGIIFVVIIIAALFILSLSRSVQNRREDAVQEVVGKENIAVQNVIKDPMVYDGLTIQVEAPITDWVTKKAFTVSTGERQGAFSRRNTPQLLILSNDIYELPKDTEGTELGIGETVNVRITGRVRITDKEELERFLGVDLDEGDIQLDDNRLIKNWFEATVILADSVEKL